MPFDMHPYLLIYLAGCAFAVFLILINKVVFWVIAWLAKDGILNRNREKILPPKSLFQKEYAISLFMVDVGIFMVDVALSWISVVIVLWQTASRLLGCAREILTLVPEEIKSFRFPLKTNPNLSRESVWAYFTALEIRVGERQPSVHGLLSGLYGVLGHCPLFDSMTALKRLESLNIIQ